MLILLALLVALIDLGGARETQPAGEPSLSWAIGIDGQPALSVYTEQDLEILLRAFPSMPVADGVRSSHGYFWNTPGIRCGEDEYGHVQRSAAFVFIDNYRAGGAVSAEEARSARRRQRGIALHNLSLLEAGELPAELGCRAGAVPSEAWTEWMPSE